MEDKFVFISATVTYVWYSLFYVKTRTRKYLKESKGDLHPGIIFKKNIFWDAIITVFLFALLYGSFITLNDKYSLKVSDYNAFFMVVLVMFTILMISTVYHLLNFDLYVKRSKK